MSDIFVNKAPKELAVIPFYATAAVFFTLLCILHFLSASDITGHYFNPPILAIVHAAALGWASMIIFGAAYQLLPVICERELFSTKMAFLSYIFLSLGTCGLIWCFWRFEMGWLMITSGSFVMASSYLYAINLYLTANDTNKSQASQHFLLISAFWLCFTTTVGLLLAINLRYTFIPRNHLDILKLHAHAGLAGWFLQLICGVASKLIPMFLLGKSKKTSLLYAALVLQNVGLILFLADGYANPVNLRMSLYGLLVFIGTICWVLYIIDTYRHRARKKIDVHMKHTGSSFLFLSLAFILIPVIIASAHTKWPALYGTFIFFGWITGIILGKTFKTLPFIVWNNRYKNLNGKGKIPMPKHLYNERLIPYQYYLYLAALILMCIGIVLEAPLLLRITGILWIALSVLYGYNVFRVIFHKTVLQQETIPVVSK